MNNPPKQKQKMKEQKEFYLLHNVITPIAEPDGRNCISKMEMQFSPFLPAIWDFMLAKNKEF